jgi:hypothetical protein
MNISAIHNMVELKSMSFFFTVHYVANPMISSVLIDFVLDLHRRSFVLRSVSLRHHA